MNAVVILRPLPARTLELVAGVPDCNDPRWPDATRPLLNMIRLSGGTTILQIVTWAREHNITGHIVRNQLAWLSFYNLVAYDDPSGKWIARPTP